MINSLLHNCRQSRICAYPATAACFLVYYKKYSPYRPFYQYHYEKCQKIHENAQSAHARKPARITLATSPENVDKSAPASVHFVFVTLAAIK